MRGLKVLTCLEGMSSFTEAAFINKADSTTVSREAFTPFFIPNGLPKLVIFDTGSVFAGAMTQMCTSLGIPYYTVSEGKSQSNPQRTIPPILKQGGEDTSSRLRIVGPMDHVSILLTIWMERVTR
jgi:hypothetical protein